MNSGIIREENKLDIVVNKPQRFDMAVNFYMCISEGEEYKLATYYYNEKWDMFYAFYDDVNKSPVLKQSQAKNCAELISEIDEIFTNNNDEKLNLAKQRFKEIMGCDCEVIQSQSCPYSYELKYSKTANMWTIYKLYNFIITSVGDLSKVLSPKQLECRLFNLNNFKNSKVVGNATDFCEKAKDELIKFSVNYKKIREIIDQCVNDIEKDIKSLKFIKNIDILDIFPISDGHKILLDEEAKKIATIIDETERGNFYMLKNPIFTKFGELKFLKIRIFDQTRLNWVAAPDFETTNYCHFFNEYKDDKRFKYIEKPTYKGLEFKTDRSLVYFLDELTAEYYNIK